MTDDTVTTVGEMLRVVTPALGEVLTEEELAATTLRVVRRLDGRPVPALENWPVKGDEEPLDEDTLLVVTTFASRCGSWMQGRETAEQMFARFRSELQDFVAESTFGWGQLRP